MKNFHLLITSLIFLTMFSFPGRTQEFKFYEFGESNEKFWLICPKDSLINKEHLVVFLHGHGASNPATYGNWILHLIEQGFIVLFPKFQTGAFVPMPDTEAERIDVNIDDAFSFIEKTYNFRPKKIDFIGHSLGGLLAANLANLYGKTNKYEVASLTLVQPGFKYLKTGALSTYDSINPNARIICVTGNNDRTAGKTFSNYFMLNTTQISDKNKIHFHINKYDDVDEKIGSSHEEPVSPNDKLRSSNSNYMILGADLVGQTNLTDSLIFWKMSDYLLLEKTEPMSSLSTIGFWSNGKPIGELSIIYTKVED